VNLCLHAGVTLERAGWIPSLERREVNETERISAGVTYLWESWHAERSPLIGRPISGQSTARQKQLGGWLMDAQWTEIPPTSEAHLFVVSGGV
jgi:hypothetical protein